MVLSITLKNSISLLPFQHRLSFLFLLLLFTESIPFTLEKISFCFFRHLQIFHADSQSFEFFFNRAIRHLQAVNSCSALLSENLNLSRTSPQMSQTLFGNPKGPVELGNPNTCAEIKLCLNFLFFQLKK